MHVALLAVAALAATANAAGVSLTVDSKTGAYSVGFGSSTFSSGPYEFTTGASSFAAPARRPAKWAGGARRAPTLGCCPEARSPTLR